MNRFKKGLVLAVMVLCIGGCRPCRGQGVDLLDVQNYGNRVEMLGIPGIEDYPDVQAILATVPQDDSSKWHLILFVQAGCASCERLKQDLKQNPSLKIIADWCHFNVYSLESKSQQFRFSRFKVTRYPLLVLYPPKRSPNYPFVYVDRMSGYNGDANGLAKRLIEKIKAFVNRYIRPNPPVFPRPTPVPTPRPYIPDLSPLIPDVPDLIPLPAPTPDTAVGEYAEYPEVILIVDPEGLGEKLKARAAEKMIQKLREKYDLRLKIRTVKWKDVGDLYPFVRRADTPAIVVTRNKRLAGFLSIGVLTAMHGEELEGATGDWDATTTSSVASGWIVVAVIGGVLLLRGVIRRRKQSDESGKESPLHRFRPSVVLGQVVDRMKKSKSQATVFEKDAQRTADDLSAEVRAEAEAVDDLKKSLD